MPSTPHILQIQMSNYVGPADKKPFVETAVERLEAIVNSPDFREEVVSQRHYRHHEGLTPAQIYNRLMTGHPKGLGSLDKPRVVDFNYTVVDRDSGKTIGYRESGTNDIFTYRAHFDEMDVPDLVSHLGHEVVGHLAGEFGHPSKNWRGRGRSVPYVVDFIIDTLLEEPVPE